MSNSVYKICVMVVMLVVVVACAHSKRVTEIPATAEQKGYAAEGLASWYGPGFKGRKTASGKRFNPKLMTAAHRTLPFGTRLKVTNLANEKTVEVVVNDRGPFIKGRIIDLSQGAAKKLGFAGAGVVKVQIEQI